MCFLRPLKIKKIIGKKVLLENNIEAYYDKNVGKIMVGDMVLVYGNLIVDLDPGQDPLGQWSIGRCQDDTKNI